MKIWSTQCQSTKSFFVPGRTEEDKHEYRTKRYKQLIKDQMTLGYRSRFLTLSDIDGMSPVERIWAMEQVEAEDRLYKESLFPKAPAKGKGGRK